MKIPKDSALLDLLSGTIIIDTGKTAFLKEFSPHTIHHDDGDVKTTKGLKGNIGLSNAKPTLSVEASVVSERQRKGQAIEFHSNRCGGEWNHSFEGSEDRRVGLLPTKDLHFLEMNYSKLDYAQLLKGNILLVFKAELEIPRSNLPQQILERLKSSFAFQKGIDPLRNFYIVTKIEICTDRFTELMEPNRSNQYRIEVSGSTEGNSGKIKSTTSIASEGSDCLPTHTTFQGSIGV